jgi:hypothetical protein
MCTSSLYKKYTCTQVVSQLYGKVDGEREKKEVCSLIDSKPEFVIIKR